MREYPWGMDPAKWVIHCDDGEWSVIPPVGSFWGIRTRHDTFEDARADFKWQIMIPGIFPRVILGHDLPEDTGW